MKRNRPSGPWGKETARSGRVLLLLILLFLIPACLGRGVPARYVEKYLLEYPPPTVAGLPALGEVIRVERFSAVQALNSPAMAYRPGPFSRDTYLYHRWRVHPADMVTDFLLRDLRESGLFRAVLSSRDGAEARFVLEGGVEDFQETGDGFGQAALTLYITLLDTAREEITRQVLFQKTYRTIEPLESQTPAALARAMSRAMEKLSERIIRDVYHEVRKTD